MYRPKRAKEGSGDILHPVVEDIRINTDFQKLAMDLQCHSMLIKLPFCLHFCQQRRIGGTSTTSFWELGTICELALGHLNARLVGVIFFLMPTYPVNTHALQ